MRLIAEKKDELRKALLDANARLAEKDSSLWGPSAQSIAKDRMGWLDLPENSRELLPALDAISAKLRALRINRIVLSGMGGSSLAPEVIARTEKKDLILLDSTHPDDVHQVLDPDPGATCFIISSKSGETIETLSHLKVIVERLMQAQCSLSEHMVIISDPESPLINWAIEHDVPFFQGDPQVGGRFSALSIFGLLPSALLGIDCSELLDDAAEMKLELISSTRENDENLAVDIVLEIMERQPYLPMPPLPLSDWIEQLVAESTGKNGVGIIPVISSCYKKEDLSVHSRFENLPLGATFFLWEWVTALLGYTLAVNPFDQPNVASAKVATSKALSEHLSFDSQVIRRGEIAAQELIKMVSTKTDYVGFLAFVPMKDSRIREQLKKLQESAEQGIGRPATIGFGPRYLHSTGQCHKGGPDGGTFIIITTDWLHDYSIPGEEFTFGELISAQALGDFNTLRESGRVTIHAHLTLDELEEFSRALREAS